jgi:hypothetical protein
VRPTTTTRWMTCSTRSPTSSRRSTANRTQLIVNVEVTTTSLCLGYLTSVIELNRGTECPVRQRYANLLRDEIIDAVMRVQAKASDEIRALGETTTALLGKRPGNCRLRAGGNGLPPPRSGTPGGGSIKEDFGVSPRMGRGVHRGRPREDGAEDQQERADRPAGVRQLLAVDRSHKRQRVRVDQVKNVGYSTHAVAFFLEYGRFIEMPLETRHQCDVRACVRPSHLLEGTRSENARDCRDRGRDKSRREANSRRRGKLSPHGAKTRCPYGHEYAPGNLYFNKNGGRACRTCALQRAKAQKAARKAKRATCSGT